MEILQYISDACATLTSNVTPSVDALGLRMVLALATIMLVWFGVQEALAHQGGTGPNMGRFLSLYMLISFAYCFTKYFDTPIPIIGFSLQSYVSGGTSNLVDVIGNDTTLGMLQTIATALSNGGSGVATFTAPYLAISFIVIQALLGVLSALVSVIIAYGELGATIIAMLGPVFIPWMLFQKTEWLFWGWLKAFLGFEFYKVVAAAVLSVVAHLFQNFATVVTGATSPTAMAHSFPVLVVLITVCLFLLLKIPAMTASLFSGSTGGHDGGIGVAMLALKAGL